ncbi:MAG TPA: PIN domain-containing protein [Longimicrobium sp.]|uniref:type II toxin-antitoxin system VapC family toxin n=1 Tax=Longimicrobium sp. TaxID=2029185 RepID=UPI002ED84EC2
MIPPGALILLDTNVLVQLVRGNAAGKRIDSDYGLGVRPDRPLISLVTVGEAKSLALKFGWSQSKRNDLDGLLRQLVVVNINAAGIPDMYAEIDHYSERVVKPARPMGKNDLWIGATAAAVGAWLMTSDKDFDHLSPKFFQRVRVDAQTGVTIP